MEFIKIEVNSMKAVSNIGHALWRGNLETALLIVSPRISRRKRRWEEHRQDRSLWKNSFMTVGGFGAIELGSRFLIGRKHYADAFLRPRGFQ